MRLINVFYTLMTWFVCICWRHLCVVIFQQFKRLPHFRRDSSNRPGLRKLLPDFLISCLNYSSFTLGRSERPKLWSDDLDGLSKQHFSLCSRNIQKTGSHSIIQRHNTPNQYIFTFFQKKRPTSFLLAFQPDNNHGLWRGNSIEFRWLWRFFPSP